MATFPSAEGALALFALRGQRDAAFEHAESLASERNLPTIAIELDGIESFGAELLKWSVATLLACSALGIHPFDEPDVLRGRQALQAILERLAVQQNVRLPTVRVGEGGIELRAEGNTRHQISTLSLSEALRTFFDLRSADGYVAVLSFLDSSRSVWSSLSDLRKQIEVQAGIPVQPTFGPRYLHYLGQFLKGGPPKGIFLILTAAAERDVAVPGAGYTFGQLQGALALGDFEALHRNDERVVWLHFSRGFASGIHQLREVLGGLSAQVRPTA